jgi:LuxR family quorum-sensing system transcriptional regulator CciR
MPRYARDCERADALRIASRFAGKAARACSSHELKTIIESAAGAMGFRYFALVHHAALGKAGRGLIRIDNYPAGWAERFIQEDFHAVDPVHQASLRASAAFAWADLSALVRLDDRHKAILTAGAEAGLASGVTVPTHVPGEPGGSCSFARDTRARIGRTDLVSAQIVGSAAFAAARRILLGTERVPVSHRLTPRQRECLLLAAQGKTDWEIGQILGLSEDTVTKYMNAARARYGVGRRVQLAINAIYRSEISFAEVIHRP